MIVALLFIRFAEIGLSNLGVTSDGYDTVGIPISANMLRVAA